MTALAHRSALLLLAAFCIAAGDEGVPGRDANYAVVGSNVEGTEWEGKTDFGVFILRFERGGVLEYTSRNGRHRNGTWKQQGNVVYLEMNNHFADYRGEIRGDRIIGDAKNVNGTTWKWNVKRGRTTSKVEIDAILDP
jgi:hypothetical protein